VLTNRPADKSVAVSRLVRGGAAILLSAVSFTTVYAGGVDNLTCIGGAAGVNCVDQWGPGGDPNVRAVPKPLPTKTTRKLRSGSANGWRNASRCSGAIRMGWRAISTRRAAANMGLALIERSQKHAWPGRGARP
jgi:hypothetical protein